MLSSRKSCCTGPCERSRANREWKSCICFTGGCDESERARLIRSRSSGSDLRRCSAATLAGQASRSRQRKKLPRAKTWVPPRTPDGQPDLQGVWTNVTATPMERPRALGDKAFFTQEEAVAFERSVREETDGDRLDGGADANLYRSYNEAFRDRGHVVGSLRTSLIVDPPNGRIPDLTPEAKARLAARDKQEKLHPADGPESRSLRERCLWWQTAGPPMIPANYNSNYQILQGPGYVVILAEMIHDARVIPLDGTPHLPQDTRLWMGDPRGHWEGNTLVVDSTNFTGKPAYAGSDKNLHLIERFTRSRSENHNVRIHHGRSNGVHQALDRTSSAAYDGRSHFRIRVS